MRKKLCLLLAFMSLITACQGQDKTIVRETIREVPTTTSTPGGTGAPGTPVASSQGGVDSVGGGNGINQRPLESYAIRVVDLPEFKEFIQPLIEEIAIQHPRFASDMVHIAINRTWFLVPVELNKLPSHIIGVGFADKELQQLAIQNLSSIWINSTLFEKYPTARDRALLVLHEIVMGIRLMKMKSNLDQCYSEIAYNGLHPENHNAHKKLRDQCALRYAFQGGGNNGGILGTGLAKVELSQEDYDNVRELVILLMNQQRQTTKNQLDAWLLDKSFRKY